MKQLHEQPQSELPDRLPFCLPDFTRYAWVSERARELWESRIGRITGMLLEVEWRAIVTGLRRCALRSIPADRIDEIRERLGQYGIGVEPLEGIALNSNYSSSLEPCTMDSPDAYWCALGRENDLKTIVRAYHENDQDVIGNLLGYPDCCIDFFRRVWDEASLVDTTWPMAVGSSSAVIKQNSTIKLTKLSLCGMQFRWLGIRAVFHLPCSFDCANSLHMAAAHLKLAREIGFADESTWLTDMLHWPVEWSALHGIAEVRSPIVKIVTRTDSTPRKYTVHYKGDPASIPQEAGAGLEFPFRRSIKRPLISRRGFQLGLANPIEKYSDEKTFVHAPWYSRDNGFMTRYAMDRSHAPIVERIRQLLVENSVSDRHSSIVDLGCGNGALVQKIAAFAPTVTVAGIDRDTEKIAHARLLNPSEKSDAFRVGDLFDDDIFGNHDEYYLVILMLGRLTEVPKKAARSFLSCIRGITRHMLVYAYEDYILHAGTLSEMALKVGVELIDHREPANVALARITTSRVD